MRHVVDGLSLSRRDLRVLQELVEVLVGDAVLGEDVEQNDPHLVLLLHVGVQQHRDDVLRVVLDALACGGDVLHVRD